MKYTMVISDLVTPPDQCFPRKPGTAYITSDTFVFY